jgi:hypothetical protein
MVVIPRIFSSPNTGRILRIFIGNSPLSSCHLHSYKCNKLPSGIRKSTSRPSLQCYKIYAILQVTLPFLFTIAITSNTNRQRGRQVRCKSINICSVMNKSPGLPIRSNRPNPCQSQGAKSGCSQEGKQRPRSESKMLGSLPAYPQSHALGLTSPWAPTACTQYR